MTFNLGSFLFCEVNLYRFVFVITVVSMLLYSVDILNETLHIFGGVFMADCNAQESSLL
jgi:hypothetical protein